MLEPDPARRRRARPRSPAQDSESENVGPPRRRAPAPLPRVSAPDPLVAIRAPLEADEPSADIEKRERAQADARLAIADARVGDDRQLDPKAARRIRRPSCLHFVAFRNRRVNRDHGDGGGLDGLRRRGRWDRRSGCLHPRRRCGRSRHEEQRFECGQDVLPSRHLSRGRAAVGQGHGDGDRALVHRELDARAGIDVGACLEGLAHLPRELGPACADACVNRHRDRRAGRIRRKRAACPEGRKGPREERKNSRSATSCRVSLYFASEGRSLHPGD